MTNGRALRRVPALVIMGVLLAGALSAAVVAAHPTTSSAAAPAAADYPSYAYATGGPTPTSGPTSCVGTTPYTAAQIVILPDGSVAPSGAPLAKTGSFYQLEDPIDSSVLVLASGVTVDGSGCVVTYATVGGDGNDTGVMVEDASSVTLEYFHIEGTFSWGVNVTNSSSVTVYDSTAPSAGYIGLGANGDTNVNFTDNNVSKSDYGVFFSAVQDGLAEGTTATDAGFAALSAYNTTDVAFVDNDASGTADYGVDLGFDYGSVILDNNVSHVATGEYGLYEAYGGDDLIQGNDFRSAAEYGIFLSYPYGPMTVVDNDLTGGFANGIYLNNGAYAGTLQITDNNLQNTTGVGMDLHDAPTTNITGNDLSLNHTEAATTAIEVSSAAGGVSIVRNRMTGGFSVGIDFGSSGSPALITGNNVANTTNTAIDDVASYGVAITSNDLSVNQSTSGFGVSVHEGYAGGGGPSVIGYNNLTGGWLYGVYLQYVAGDFDIVDNDFVGYIAYGVYTDELYAPVQITMNDLAASPTTGADDLDGVVLSAIVYGSLSVVDNNFTGVHYAFLDENEIYGNFTFDDNRMVDVVDEGLYDDASIFGSANVANDTYSAGVGDLSTDGLYLDYVYGPLAFTGNAVADAYYGILTYGATGTLTVSGNTIVDPWAYGVDVEDAYGGFTETQNLVEGNGSTYSAKAIGLLATYTPGSTSAVIDNNTVTGGLEIGIDFQSGAGPSNVISGNTIRGTVDDGIYVLNSETPTYVTDNSISTTSGDGICIDDAAAVVIQGNLLQHSNVAIFLADLYSTLEVEGNNASGSNLSLDVAYTDEDAPAVIEANDFSDSKAAYANDTYGDLVGNDFLGTPVLFLEGDSFASFYHNDIDTSAGAVLTLTASIPETGVYDDPPPVGGNYWTGYTPTSCANDICAPEYLVPSGGGSSGYYDEYPLGSAWTNYAITFAEKGLPTGTVWSVAVGSTLLTTVAPAALEFYPQNVGSEGYSFSVAGAGSYTIVAPASGSFTASGSAQTISVTFAEPTFAVSFTESGLGVGADWFVNSTGTPSFASASFSISSSGSQTFHLGDLPNGTYRFTVAPDVGGCSPSGSVSGSFTVSGTAVSVSYPYAHCAAPAPSSSAGKVPRTDFYAAVGGAAAAAVAAIAGWMLYLRRRPPRSAAGSGPPGGASGVQAWSGSGGGPPGAGGSPPPPPASP